jgi:hypothetical protein
MKLLVPAAFGLALLLSGCESSLQDDVRSALGPREAPQTRTYDADQKATFAAARSVAQQMGFRITRSGAAAGEIDALSEIAEGDAPGSSRQVSMRIRLSPGEGSGTQLELSLTEVIEDQSSTNKGGATQTPLLDTPMYADFLRNVQTALANPPKP